MIPLTHENIAVGDRIVITALDGPTNYSLRHGGCGNLHVGDKATIAEIRTGDYPIRVKWDKGNTSSGPWFRLCYFGKEEYSFKKGDRVVYNQVKGSNFTLERNGKVGTVREAVIDVLFDSQVKVTWDDGSGNASAPYAVNLTKVVEPLKAGDRVVYNQIKGSTPTPNRSGKMATVVGPSPSHGEGHVRVTWDDDYAYVCNPYIENLTKVEEVENPLEAVAKAFWSHNVSEVERLLAEFKPRALPVGAVFSSEELKMTWVVAEAGVMAVDLVTGTTSPVTMSLDEFAKYANENGMIVSLTNES